MSTMMKACWHCGVPVHVENTGFHVCLVGDLKASVECLRAEREGLVRDAERYRWLRGEFELCTEHNSHMEVVAENAKGQLISERVHNYSHFYNLKDSWRFGEVSSNETAPMFDALVDAEIDAERSKT